MVKLRYSQNAQSTKKEDSKTRTVLSFSEFRRSFATADGGNVANMPSTDEIANACCGLNSERSFLSEEQANKDVHASPFARRNPLGTIGLRCPDANTDSQITRVLNEISDSAKHSSEPSPATQLAAAFNRWRYSHLKVEERLHMELIKAIHRAEIAESIVEERNIEIKKLNEELRQVEEEKSQIITKLQADIMLLQRENDCCCHEVQNVIDQLAGNGWEVPGQPHNKGELGYCTGKPGKKHSKEVKESTSFADERDSNKMDFTLEEVGMTWAHSRGNGRPKAPEAVSMELEHHLKRLTSYVRNLEACIQNGGHNSAIEKRSINQEEHSVHRSDFADAINPIPLCSESSDSMQIGKANEHSQNRNYSSAGVKKSSYILQSGFELNLPRDSTQRSYTIRSNTLKQQPYLYQNQKLVSWSQSHSQERITTVTTVDTPAKFTNLLSRCISWKWRWAAAASQLKALSKEIQNMTVTKESNLLGAVTNSQSSTNRDKFISSMKKLGFIHVHNLHTPHVSNKGGKLSAKVKQKEAKFSVPGYKVISIVLSMWRASIKNAKLEQEAVCNSEKLSRLLAGLPCFIQKFEERRYLERMFYHWALHMLRSKIHIYHTSLHQSGSWSSWPKQPPNSLWGAQLGVPDSRAVEGNGYRGRYMKYTQSKPNDRQQLSIEAKKPDRNHEKGDSVPSHQESANGKSSDLDVDVHMDDMNRFTSDFSSLPQKDNGVSLHPHKHVTTSSHSSNKTVAAPANNTANGLSLSGKHNYTSSTEKAVQALQVSLYKELQNLQDLIMKEAQIHQAEG
ncbi:hypothetical protein KP509_26G045900 [Ceratopteris richardii]|uniref:Uncharacterized protein n=1 Tax=Ceratopteris richardii TaxID=49495 RepID=A0A8T2RLL7_CERRI|nr:hypothetical protein KP509_26G045900 [Ceratopteris richardii]